LRNRATQMLRESFLPVLMVLVGLFLLLLYVQFKAESGAGRITIIEIPRTITLAEMSDPDQLSDSAIGVYATAKSDDPRILEAEALMEQRKWAEAEAIYVDILAKQPSSANHSALGVLYQRSGDSDQALAQFDLAVATKPLYPPVYFNRGMLFAARRNYARAVTEYQQLIALIPSHFEGHYNMGIALLKEGRPEQAIKAFTKASTLAGQRRKAKALYNLGVVHRQLGPEHDEQARKAFNNAIRQRPDYMEPRMALVGLLPDSKAGRTQAVSEYRALFELKSDYPPLYFRIAKVQSDQGQRKSAIASYRKAVQFNPEYLKARYNLGLLLLAEHHWRDARAEFNWILRRTPDSAEAYFNLGRVAHGLKDHAGAIAAYAQAITLRDGNYPEALLNTGLAYARQKDYAAAAQSYRTAIALRADYSSAWYNLGLTLKRQGDLQGAMDAFHTALQHDPSYSKAWYNLGVIHSKAGRDTEAVDAYRAAIRIKPHYTRAKVNLAVKLTGLDQLDEAIRLYNEVLDRDDTYTLAWSNLGLAYLRTKQSALAEEAFRKVVSLDPEDSNGKLYLARSLLAQNKHEEAISRLTEAIDQDTSNPKLRMELGRVYQAAGRQSEAVDAFNKARALKFN